MAYTPTPRKKTSVWFRPTPSILMLSPRFYCSHRPHTSQPAHSPAAIVPLSPARERDRVRGAFRSCGNVRHQDHFALTPIRQGRGQRSWNLAIAFSFPVTGSSLPVRAARVPVLSAFHAGEHGKALRRRLFSLVNSALADSREYRPARAGWCNLRLHGPARQCRSGRARRCRGSAVSRSRRHCM